MSRPTPFRIISFAGVLLWFLVAPLHPAGGN